MKIMQMIIFGKIYQDPIKLKILKNGVNPIINNTG